jgi:hypothetical protein
LKADCAGKIAAAERLLVADDVRTAACPFNSFTT